MLHGVCTHTHEGKNLVHLEKNWTINTKCIHLGDVIKVGT